MDEADEPHDPLADEHLGEFVAHLAHALNNAFGVIVGSLGYAREDLADAGVDEDSLQAVDDALGAGRDGAETLALALACVGRQMLRPAPVDLNETVSALARLVESTLPEGVALRLALSPGLPPVHADAGALERAVLALAANASQAMPDGGTLAVSTRRLDDVDGLARDPAARVALPCVAVEICDDGEGMSPEVLRHACEPYFTTRSDRGNRGLGLAVTRGFAIQSGGLLSLRSRPGEGTGAVLALPSARHAR